MEQAPSINVNVSASGSNTPLTPNEKSNANNLQATEMPGFFKLLNETFSVYGKKWKSFLLLVLATYGFFFASLLVLFPAVIAVKFIYETSSLAAIIVGIFAAVIGAVAYIYVSLWFSVAMIIVLRDANENIGFVETMKRARPFIGKYFEVSIITGLIALLGFVLLIIPGIIFSIWYMSARFLVVTNNETGMSAISQSRELARGQFWKIFALGLLGTIALLILEMAVSMIPFYGSLISSILLAPLALTYSYLIFDHLRTVKGVTASTGNAGTVATKTATNTTIPKAMAGLGLIIFIILIGLAVAFAPQIGTYLEKNQPPTQTETLVPID